MRSTGRADVISNDSALYCTPSAKVRNSVANVRVTSQPGGRCCSKVAWSCRRQTVELPVPGESREAADAPQQQKHRGRIPEKESKPMPTIGGRKALPEIPALKSQALTPMSLNPAAG